MELTEKEMMNVSGGASWAVIAAIGAGIVYLIGALSGYTNPTKCNN